MHDGVMGDDDLQELLDWIVPRVHAFHGIKQIDSQWSMRFTIRHFDGSLNRSGSTYTDHVFAAPRLAVAAEEAAIFLLGIGREWKISA